VRILLDTSAYSAFRRGQPQIVDTLGRAEEIFVSAVVIGELLTGFSRGGREQQNRRELRGLLEIPRVHLAPLTDETAERYAAILRGLLERGTPIPTNDVWIAASAMELGLRVLTTDADYMLVQEVVTDHVDVSTKDGAPPR